MNLFLKTKKTGKLRKGRGKIEVIENHGKGGLGMPNAKVSM